jgi:3-deoxy-7-phosphoheptulonate synthase
MSTMQDTRVLGYEPLVSPSLRKCLFARLTTYSHCADQPLNAVRHEIVSSEASVKNITEARQVAANIIAGDDDRVLVIVGPCSIHDPEQAMGEFLYITTPTKPAEVRAQTTPRDCM